MQDGSEPTGALVDRPMEGDPFAGPAAEADDETKMFAKLIVSPVNDLQKIPSRPPLYRA